VAIGAKPVQFARRCLGAIAVLSLLGLAGNYVFPIISGAEHAGRLAFLKSQGHAADVAEFQRERLRKVDAAAADARAAWVTFAVAMAGLACSKP
jgi:hypothetical protein